MKQLIGFVVGVTLSVSVVSLLMAVKVIEVRGQHVPAVERVPLDMHPLFTPCDRDWPPRPQLDRNLPPPLPLEGTH